MAIKTLYNNSWTNASQWTNVINSKYPDGTVTATTNDLIKLEIASFDMIDFDSIPTDAIITGLTFYIKYSINVSISDIDCTCTITNGTSTLGTFLNSTQHTTLTEFNQAISIVGLDVTDINTLNVNVSFERGNDKDNGSPQVDGIWFVVSYNVPFDISLEGLRDELSGKGGTPFDISTVNLSLTKLKGYNDLLYTFNGINPNKDVSSSLMDIHAQSIQMPASNITDLVMRDSVYSYGDSFDALIGSAARYFNIGTQNYLYSNHNGKLNIYAIYEDRQKLVITVETATASYYKPSVTGNQVTFFDATEKEFHIVKFLSAENAIIVEEGLYDLEFGTSGHQILDQAFIYNDYVLCYVYKTPNVLNQDIGIRFYDKLSTTWSSVIVHSGFEELSSIMNFNINSEFVKDNDNYYYISINISDISETYRGIKVYKIDLENQTAVDTTPGSYAITLTPNADDYRGMYHQLAYCDISNKIYLLYSFNWGFQQTSCTDDCVVYEYNGSSWSLTKLIHDYGAVGKVGRSGKIFCNNGFLFVITAYSQPSFNGLGLYTPDGLVTVINTSDNSYHSSTPSGAVLVISGGFFGNQVNNINGIFFVYARGYNVLGAPTTWVFDTFNPDWKLISWTTGTNYDSLSGTTYVKSLMPIFDDDKMYFYGEEDGVSEKLVISDYSANVVYLENYVTTAVTERNANLGTNDEAVTQIIDVLEMNGRLCYFNRLDSGVSMHIFDGYNYIHIKDFDLPKDVSSNPSAGSSFKVQHISHEDYDLLIFGLPDIYYDGGNPLIRITHTYIYKFSFDGTFEFLDYFFGESFVEEGLRGIKEYSIFNIKTYVDENDTVGSNKALSLKISDGSSEELSLPSTDTKIITEIGNYCFIGKDENTNGVGMYKFIPITSLGSSSIKSIGTVDYNSGTDATIRRLDCSHCEENGRLYAIISSEQDVTGVQAELHYLEVSSFEEPTPSTTWIFVKNITNKLATEGLKAWNIYATDDNLICYGEVTKAGQDYSAFYVHDIATNTGNSDIGTNAIVHDTLGYDYRDFYSYYRKDKAWFGSVGYKTTLTPSMTPIANPAPYIDNYNDLFSKPVAIDGNYIVVAAKGLNSNGLFSGKVFVFDTTGSLIYTLNNPNAYGTGTDDYFGTAVAISGNYIVASAIGEDADGVNGSGRVYVFDLDGTTPTIPIYTLENPNIYGTSDIDYFGFSVSIDGNYIVVGAYQEDDIGGTSSGAAYIYDLTSGTPTVPIHELVNPNIYDISTNDYFGKEVAISGNYAVIAAVGEDDIANLETGNCYIFNIITGVLIYTLHNPNDYFTKALDRFGTAVAILDNYVLVSAVGEDDTGGPDSGKAYIFDLDSATPIVPIYTLDNPNAYGTSANDYFGTAVAISNGYAAIGVYQEDDINGNNSGVAYIFSLSTGDLSYTFLNPDLDANNNDDFGSGIAINDNYLVVGAPGEAYTGTDSSGKVYVYDISETNSPIYINYVLTNVGNRVYSEAQDMSVTYPFTGSHSHILFTDEGLFLPVSMKTPTYKYTTFLISSLFGI